MTSDRPSGPFDSTLTLSDDDVAWLRATGEDAELALQVYHRDGLREVPLPEGCSLVIGRAPPADVPIRDPSLSRTHARVTCELGEVWLEDLDSTNGTQVDGRSIRRCEVRPGARIVLGATPAAVVPVGGSAAAGGVEGHDDFQGGLEAEVSRARAFRQPLALLMLRVGDDASFGAVLARLRTGLRSFEHLGLYSDDVVELLLPQCDEDEAARRAGELSSTAGGAACGVGVYPRHGSTADELLGAARAALATASAATPVRHAEARTARIVADPATVEGDVVVASAAMRSLMDTIARIADAGIPVLIQGETGTGKELVARAIHRQGPRSGGPLVCVNCGGIPGQLVESTLFGHERGAFTGADRQAKGVFEAASGGTILLDEIGELPPAAQAALLRVLESGHVSRVGSTTEIRVDVRVLAATHRDLAAWADEGRFRRDLLYRLNAMTLEIPPLRERTEDIPPLARHFLACSADAVTAGVDGIDGAVMALLQVHSWPGNVRELRNAIERAAVIARDTSITLDDLPEPVRRLQRTDPGPAPAPAPAPAPDVGRRPAGVGPLRERLRRYEIELIVEALNLHGGHRGRAAAALGVPLRTLSHRIQALGIRRGRYQRPGE